MRLSLNRDINRLVIVFLWNYINSSIYSSFLCLPQTLVETFLLVSNFKYKYFINLLKILYFEWYWDNYDPSLFISFRAFLPSLSVLKTSHESEEMIKIESVIREIKDVSILLVTLLKIFWACSLKFKKILGIRSRVCWYKHSSILVVIIIIIKPAAKK